MQTRVFGNFPVRLLVITTGMLVSGLSGLQAQPSEPIPRLANGQPDLQGTWDYRTITPLQRPEEYGDLAVLTAEEAARFEVARQEALNRDNFTDTTTTGDYNEFWYDRGNEILGTLRTSLITSPANGRLPPMTPAAQATAEEAVRAAELNHGIEVRPLSERCIMGFNSGPPMLPSAYNNNVQLVQTADYVVIHNEMVHNARIVRMNDASHRELPRKWEGDSIGYWDGDTLVIETRHFAGPTSFLNSGPKMELQEKFWLIDADTLGYEFTVTDPSRWEAPWTTMFPMVRSTAPIYEYACHEGNYSMAGIMAGWRTQEVQEELGIENK